MILKGIVFYLLAVTAITFIVFGICRLKARRSWRRYGVPLLAILYIVPPLFLLVCNIGGRNVSETNVAKSLQQRVDSLLAVKRVDVGVAVRFRGEWLCAVNIDERFPMMSVFKLHQAVAVTDSLPRSPLSLDSKILITNEMLHKDTYSPMRETYPEGNVRLSIEELLRYSLLQSDNNACDILFQLFGGTSYVQAKMETLGLRDTQIRWTEDDMHQDTRRANGNFTTPGEAVKLLETAYGNDWLRHCMEECQTGQGRIPVLLPKDKLRIGHKTGTGDALPNGLLSGINDIGFIELTNNKEHYFIAVFCKNSAMSLQETEAVIAEISRMAYDTVCYSLHRIP